MAYGIGNRRKHVRHQRMLSMSSIKGAYQRRQIGGSKKIDRRRRQAISAASRENISINKRGNHAWQRA